MFSWINLNNIAKWVGVEYKTEIQTPIQGISTDSRNIKNGEVFIALRGDSFDGHDFIERAISGGAVAVISEKLVKTNVPVFVVSSTLNAMVKIAKNIRDSFSGNVFAVTGSAGKSSTKAWIGALLGDYTVTAPQSFNNLIGVAKTIFLLEDSTKNLVLEMGMNAPNEISTLCTNFSPEGGLITNIGDAHIGKLGSLEAIYLAKKELFDWLASNNKIGIALNIDDEKVIRAYKESFKIKPHTISYSTKMKEADVFVCSSQIDSSSGFLNLEMKFLSKHEGVQIPVFGLFHSYNVAAAVAGALLMKVDEDEILERLPTIKPQIHRGEIIKTKDFILIDESYNSNPTALKLSLETLFQLDPKKRKVLVLGDMLELGDYSEKLHENIANIISTLTVNSKIVIIGIGNIMSKVLTQLKKSKISIYSLSNAEEALSFLKNTVEKDDIIFVKGSRKNGLDIVVNGLLSNSKQ